MVRMSGLKRVTAAIAGVAAIGVASADFAAAKVGNNSSSGSRGGMTHSAPPSTATAPKGATPMDRTMTQPGAAAKSQAGATAAAASAAAKPSMFGGMKGLLMGGLIGAGLASIFGAGALASGLGFILQAVLIGGLLFLAFNFFRKRFGGAPAMATASAGLAPQQQRPMDANLRNASLAGGAASSALTISPDDFNAFERLLGEIQLAYGRGDQNALGDRVTPEMLSYFAGDLAANERKGVRNELGAPKLLQGDLAEAWVENHDEYATVAMRFSLIDKMVEISTGRLVSGNATIPQESTELWTFRRPRGGRPNQWELSAIQQTA